MENSDKIPKNSKAYEEVNTDAVVMLQLKISLSCTMIWAKYYLNLKSLILFEILQFPSITRKSSQKGRENQLDKARISI